MTSPPVTAREEARLMAAVAEVETLIRRAHPEAIFRHGWGDDPAGLYIDAVIEADEPLDLMEDDTLVDHLLHLQVDQELPIYVVPRRPSRATSS